MAEFKYIVTKEDHENQRQVKDLLRRGFSFSSRLRTKIKKADTVRLNGKPMRPFWIPEEGDVITVALPPEEPSHYEPEDIPVNPIYEDDDLLVINKAPGYTVHPTKGHPCHTLANGVMKYMEETGQSFRIRFVNRLDMDTSGLVVLGKNAYVQDKFVEAMHKGDVSKIYIAAVKGILEEDEGTVDAPIGKAVDDEVCRAVVEGGKKSVTHYRVIERFEKGYTLIELRLETGRTHQIRVHMNYIGHPVVGDFLYGGDAPWLIDRQALHASRLIFDHPVTGRKLDLSAPLPEDMESLLNKIR